MQAAGSPCDGDYNGGGGVHRSKIGYSDLLDAREGAPQELADCTIPQRDGVLTPLPRIRRVCHDDALSRRDRRSDNALRQPRSDAASNSDNHSLKAGIIYLRKPQRVGRGGEPTF